MSERPPKARYIEVIEVAFLRGSGVAPDAVREVIAYYSTEGRLLAENDPMPATSIDPKGDLFVHPRLGVAALKESWKPEPDPS